MIDNRPSAFELKSGGFTLPMIRLLGDDLDAVAHQLGTKVEQAPDFFRNTPIVIDLGALPPDAQGIDFPMLVGLLRGYGLIPFGVRGGLERHHAAARAMELAVLGESRVTREKPAGAPALPSRPAPRTRPAEPDDEPGDESVVSASFTLITRPIRSGQRIHAMGGDLSIVGPVSSGAELMADGNIHVYGPLRGRAMAGMNGNLEARIFCLDLQAELVSIAGHYRVSENIPATLRGVTVQIYLDGQALRIEPL
ncbi:septum site-determining protein MinC [Thioalkalicoccus limnaeus]|uniref:Probable septum site-determining protein MinC n=1 Tax=Thioalkalicoccus limnaeus TaxID=120681 RepID=A0ABV4BCJ7_9GAMM